MQNYIMLLFYPSKSIPSYSSSLLLSIYGAVSSLYSKATSEDSSDSISMNIAK